MSSSTSFFTTLYCINFGEIWGASLGEEVVILVSLSLTLQWNALLKNRSVRNCTEEASFMLYFSKSLKRFSLTSGHETVLIKATRGAGGEESLWNISFSVTNEKKHIFTLIKSIWSRSQAVYIIFRELREHSPSIGSEMDSVLNFAERFC